MNILQVNYCDLPGRNFNGYDLHCSLNQQEGILARQLVMDRTGKDETTGSVCTKKEIEIQERLLELERKYGMTNLLEPFTDRLITSDWFTEADIVHYQIVHLRLASLLSIEKMFKIKPSIWTIHDPWLLTGHCVHPLSCNKWKSGCRGCLGLKDAAFPMDIDKAEDQWRIKDNLYPKIQDNVDLVVASKWMLDHIKTSPLTENFKHVHLIPFGIDIEKYIKYEKEASRKKLGIKPENVVVSFRSESNEIKGSSFAIEALNSLLPDLPITILVTGHMKLPDEINHKYQVIELGWQQEEGMLQFFSATDIFLMPSLAESFGLMAIEAMASECSVVVFKGTSLEGLTFAPECGVAVPYKDCIALKDAIQYLVNSKNERVYRGRYGRELVKQYYKYSEYVKKHIELYRSVIERKKSEQEQFQKSMYYICKESKRRAREMSEKMDKLHIFQSKLKSVSNNKAEKLCIFCAGNYGRIVYHELRKRLVLVDYVVDNNTEKWGHFEDNTRCVGMQELLNDKGNVLIIVANKVPEIIIQDLKQRGFTYILSKQELDVMMQNTITVHDLGEMYGIEELDYSSSGIQTLLNQFNNVISDLCFYYENRIRD